MQWTAIEGAESYNVYLSTEQSPPTKPAKTVTETVTVLDGLTNKTVYYVWIKAVSKSGTSDFSPASRGIPWSPYDPPATPERPIVVSGIYQLTISWEECGGAVSYMVYISPTPDGWGVGTITTSTTTTSVVIRNLEGGNVYYVRVRAQNSRGQGSEYSPIEVGVPKLPTAVPASPAMPLIIVRDQELSVTWQAVEGARTYQVWLGTTDNSAEAQQRGFDFTADMFTYSIYTNEWVYGTTYYVWITAKNDLGTSGFSPYASAKPIGNMGTVTVNTGEQELLLSWSAVAGADQYEVYYNTTYTRPESPAQTIVETTTTISGLTNGTTYYVWVRGTNASGATFFREARGTPVSTSAPTLIAGNTQITVGWTSIPDANHYEIFYGTDVNPPQTATQTVNAQTTSATITGLTNGTTYYVWVRGVSYYVTLSDPATAKPIGNMGTVTVSADGQRLVLSWSAVAGADQYDVYYSTSNTMPGSSEQTVATTTTTISGLTAGTTYYVWVRGKNANGAGGVSAVASGRPIGSTSAPMLVAGNAQITVSWTAIAEANQYEIFYGTAVTPPQTADQTVNASTTTVTITGLTNGTSYNVWIRGRNSSGTGAYSAPASAKPIGNMGAVTVSADGQQLLLSWDAVAGADQYEVYYSTTTTMPESPVQTVSTTTATITGLTNGTTYYVWVRGKNANGTGGVSTASGKLIGSTSAPTLTAGNVQITASWTAIAGADQYEVFCGIGATPPPTAAQTVNASTTTVTITGLVNGTTYNVWIRGKNSSGTGTFSDPANAKPIGNMGTVTVSSGNQQLSLSWSAVAGADQYEVYYNTTNTMPVSPAQTVTTTTATISGLTNGTTYYVWVKGKNANGESNVSATASGSPIGSTSAPTLIAGNNWISVSWTAIAEANQYEVFYGTGANPPPTAAQVVYAPVTLTTITGLVNGTSYNVWVRGMNSSGTGAYSDPSNAKPIGTMGTVTLSAEGQQLLLSWYSVAGADQYEIYYSTSNARPESPVQTVSTTTATIGGLTSGTTYYVWVKGKNANGESNVSTVASGRLVGSTSAPTLVAGNSQISVSWTAIADVNQYEIFCGTGANPPQTAAQTVNTPATSVTITGLVNGTSYNVWIRGRNSSGTGAYSLPASAKPIGNMGTVTLSAGNQQLSLSWTAVAGADQYEVYYNTSNTRPGSPAQTVATTTATISGLTNGTTYYVWVKGKNANGESNVSTVVSGRPLGTPGTPTVSPSYSTLSVTWTTVAGADEYEVYYGTGTPTTLATTTSGTTVTITGLTSGTTYNVRLRAKNANGISDYGPSASGMPGSPGLYRGDVRIDNQNLDASLTYISANAVSGDNYFIVLGADESVAPKNLSYSNRTV
ncbi:MAG: fibronectin type III domain-containing protein, partial [Treponema sp.]|nr:fibronectin type III domain-containing protein [Treponema sp.]